MIKGILLFDEVISEKLHKLRFKQLCFFCAWCIENLYSKYSPFISEKLDGKTFNTISKFYNEIWAIVDNPETIDEKKVKKNISQLQRMEVEDELDELEVDDCGVIKLFEAIENTFTFILSKDIKIVVAIAFLPIDVIDTILVNDYNLDTTDIDKVIDHQLLQNEFSSQLQLVDFIGSVNPDDLNSNAKKLYR